MKNLFTALILTSLFLVGCGGEAPEKERFIDANAELACMLLEAGDDLSSVEKNAKDIFRKHGFDVDDETPVNPGCDPNITDLEDENRCMTKMEQIAEKYIQDEDVQAAIIEALEGCPGDIGDIIGDFDAPADPVTE